MPAALSEIRRVAHANCEIVVAVPSERYDRATPPTNHMGNIESSIVSSLSDAGFTVQNMEKRKWWAAVSNITRAKVYSSFPKQFWLNPNTGVWELAQDTLVGKAVMRLTEQSLQLFERASQKLEKISMLKKFLNHHFSFETYIEATKP